MHFRLLVAIVYREFIAHTQNITIMNVTPEDFIQYSCSLRLKQKGKADTVRNIFRILFQADPKFQEVASHVAMCIGEPDTLIRVLLNPRLGINELISYSFFFFNS